MHGKIIFQKLCFHVLAEVIKSHVVASACSWEPTLPRAPSRREDEEARGAGQSVAGLQSAPGQHRAPLPSATDSCQQNCLIQKLMYMAEDNFKIVLLSYCYLLQVKLFTYKMCSSNSAYIIACSSWKLSGSWTKADNIIALVLCVEKERQRVKVIPRVKWQVGD